MSYSLTLAAAAFLAWTAAAQSPDQIRRATLSGAGGSSGKCTIEVRVDMIAELDLYGDTGRLRTLAGQPATWTRFECTGPLPANMTDFRFRGIDGRGTVRLLQDPRNNNSMAVIRIEDPRSGAEGFTFEVEWSGGSGAAPAGGFPGMEPAPAPGPVPAASQRRPGGRPWDRNQIKVEQALDLCRAEIHARGARDYGLEEIDVTAAGADTAQGRRNWVAGTFMAAGGPQRRAASYRFNCEVDYLQGRVRALEILRPDGTAAAPAAAATATGGWGTPAVTGAAPADQTGLLRACQDAVAARANRDGYQNVTFTATAADPRRAGLVTGAISAVRGPLTDVFDFSCTVDARTMQVTNLQFSRR